MTKSTNTVPAICYVPAAAARVQRPLASSGGAAETEYSFSVRHVIPGIGDRVADGEYITQESLCPPRAVASAGMVMGHWISVAGLY